MAEKQQEDSLPVVLFEGRLVVVRTVSEAEEAVQILKESEGFADGIGLDLEWDPDKSHAVSNPVALVQLATHSVAVLVHLPRLQYVFPDCFRQLLLDESVRKFTHVRLPSQVFVRLDSSKLCFILKYYIVFCGSNPVFLKPYFCAVVRACR